MMPSTLAVTALVPTYNRKSLLSRALASVLAQRDVDVQVLVVDDGSEDGTAEMLRSRVDGRVQLIPLEHSGNPGFVRNVGLERVSTPWVAFLDDDDLWAPSKLRLQLEATAAITGAAWSAVGAIAFASPRPRISGAYPAPGTGDELLHELLATNCVPGGGSGVLASTELVRDLGGFSCDIPRSEDWDMWIRLALASPLAAVNLPLVGYRVSTDGRAHRHSPQVNQAVQLWMRERYGHLDERYRVQRRDVLAARRYSAQAAARAGRRREAASQYLGLGLSCRRPKDIALAAACLLDPQLSTRIRDRRALAKVDRDWVESGRRWLEPLLA